MLAEFTGAVVILLVSGILASALLSIHLLLGPRRRFAEKNDAYYVKQVELNGKKYNLFKSKTNATTRVIRAADGAVLYSGTVQNVDGQGNTEDKAFVDGFRAAATEMAKKLDADLAEIRRALLGG